MIISFLPLMTLAAKAGLPGLLCCRHNGRIVHDGHDHSAECGHGDLCDCRLTVRRQAVSRRCHTGYPDWRQSACHCIYNGQASSLPAGRGGYLVAGNCQGISSFYTDTAMPVFIVRFGYLRHCDRHRISCHGRILRTAARLRDYPQAVGPGFLHLPDRDRNHQCQNHDDYRIF